ncbi:30S ribosomal protein S18 [Candidatus Mycoplasma mahonii]|uniref:30S ribosomal protein S18 n=1 Tax=Candidatus Mycoplasma mahonii TaxID=3004105 RepID=UPI0026EB35BE|nr:30S ribosomal protein S18 [Candidatus Mycoplasma mahonii]WKX02706.1 30S ribosomal protein S18 [Candidatus Mycoplasma mahonii]
MENFKKSKKVIKRKKWNPFLPKEVRYVDYKNVELLEKFINSHGKILAAHVTGLSAAQQRNMARAIKRARMMSLLPFTKERIRR